MAGDIINPDAIGKGALSFFGGVGDAIIYILLFVMVALLIWIIYYIISFKIKIIIREKVSDNKNLIKIDKGKIVKDRNGVRWLRLFKHKTSIPEPDSKFFDITSKGKKLIEFFKTGVDFIPVNIGTTDIDDKFSFTPAQRQMMIHECRESEAYRKRTAMDLLKDAIPYMALVLIIIGLLIFMPDIIDSKAGAVKAYNGVADKFYDVADRLAEAGCNPGVVREVEEPPN